MCGTQPSNQWVFKAPCQHHLMPAKTYDPVGGPMPNPGAPPAPLLVLLAVAICFSAVPKKFSCIFPNHLPSMNWSTHRERNLVNFSCVGYVVIIVIAILLRQPRGVSKSPFFHSHTPIKVQGWTGTPPMGLFFRSEPDLGSRVSCKVPEK